MLATAVIAPELSTLNALPAPADNAPVVVILSPLVVGVSVVPVLDQYPSAPEVGAVDVKFFDPSVYTADEAVKPDTVTPVNVGESPVPNPKLVLAVFPDSATKFVPLPTMKLPSDGVKPDKSSN